MLTPKNKALLLKLANHAEPSLTIGKGDLDSTLLSAINNALTAHELIKIRVLTSQGEERSEIADKINLALGSETVKILGRILILYKKNERRPRITL